MQRKSGDFGCMQLLDHTSSRNASAYMYFIDLHGRLVYVYERVCVIDERLVGSILADDI